MYDVYFTINGPKCTICKREFSNIDSEGISGIYKGTEHVPNMFIAFSRILFMLRLANMRSLSMWRCWTIVIAVSLIVIFTQSLGDILFVNIIALVLFAFIIVIFRHRTKVGRVLAVFVNTKRLCVCVCVCWLRRKVCRPRKELFYS